MNDPIELLEQAREELETAIATLRQVRKVAPELKGMLDAYTIPHLVSWCEDERQPGSIPSLLDNLEDSEDEE